MNKELDKLKLIDKNKPKCKILFRDIDKHTDKEINTKLMENNNLDGFFRIYLYKCPVEGIHIFENEKCKKCNVTNDMLVKRTLFISESILNHRYEMLYNIKLIVMIL